MPTFIKTGFWDRMVSNNPIQAKAPKGWLNLDQFVNSKLSGDTSNTCPLELKFKPGSVGQKVSFTKTSGSDPNTNKDVIIPGQLEITRGNSGGIYNIALESDYNSENNSPVNTFWNTQYVDAANTSWAPLWDVQNRNYTDWRDAVDGADRNVPPQYVGIYSVMKWDNGDDSPRYWLIKFTQWGVGNTDEYGFAYERYEILPEVYFQRPDNQPNVVDVISAGVHLKRNNNRGLYNAVIETSSEKGASPINTKWNSSYIDSRPGYSGWGDLSNLESRKYTSFVDALDGSVGSNIPGTDLVMWDVTTDLYYKINFDSWTEGEGSGGGGFSYYRTVIPQSCGIKFADGTVLNTAPTGGGGSTGSGPIAVDGTSLYSTSPSTSAFSTDNGIFLGENAGLNATGAENSNFLGGNAGVGATNAEYSNFFGYQTGQDATHANRSNFLGRQAGQDATNANDSNFLGYQAGFGATNAPYSNFFGINAGNSATNADNSNFFGNGAGQNATSAYRSNFLGRGAGFEATNADNSNFFGENAGRNATIARYSNFLGFSAGEGTTNASSSNFLGYQSGFEATEANNSNFLGQNAGYQATYANYSNFLGTSVGRNATNASYSNFFGFSAGINATSASNSNFLGTGAGGGAANASNSNFLGANAGQNATNASSSNFLGNSAGNGAANASNSNFLGQQAGFEAINAGNSNFLGRFAGQGATNAEFSNFMGLSAGQNSTSGTYSNFFGSQAGQDATGAYASNFIGRASGQSATDAYQSNFLGNEAGFFATTAHDSNFLGYRAGRNSTGNNVNAFGNNAGNGNALNGQTIFSNASMPSFADHAAAAAAITVVLGASAGSTYLYHNQATNSIGAVRL